MLELVMCLLVEGWLFWFEDVWYRQSEGKGENNDWFYMMERERERERERDVEMDMQVLVESEYW